MARKTRNDSMEKLLRTLRERSEKAHQKQEASAVPKGEMEVGARFWKMKKGKRGLTYNFHGFGPLSKWMSRTSNTSKHIISHDEGRTWRRWDSVNADLKAGMPLAQAIAKARPVKVK